MFVVFDATNRESFEGLDKWVGDVRRNCGDKTVKVLVCTKSDRQGRVVTTEETRLAFTKYP